MVLLQDKDVQQKLPGWTVGNNVISREFDLKDFQSAITFIIKIGFSSEKMDHHPDIFLHSYNKVKITLSTHSEGGITEKDLKLGAIINGLTQ